MALDQKTLQELPKLGRGTDTVLAHMTLGEIVVPRQFMEDPKTAEAIQNIFKDNGVNIGEFTVGDSANKINPETGYPEFFKKLFKNKIFRTIAPIALSALAPGLGTAIGSALGAGAAFAPVVGGAAIGAGFGAAGGGGLKDAAIGGVTGGLAGGGGTMLGKAAGFTGAAAKGVGGALTGAVGGAASGGGLESALLGAGLGGAGGYISAGGNVPGLGEASRLGAGGMGPATQGSGLLGAATRNTPLGGGLSSLTGGNTPMFGNALKIGGAFFEDSATRDNNKELERRLLETQGRAEQQLSPYTEAGGAATNQLSQALSAGFNPGDLTQDPGYQFRLQQGEEALRRQMAASGLGQSGAALKASQEYGQGLADQTYNEAFQRHLQQNQQLQGAANMGLGAAVGTANIGMDAFGGQSQLIANNQESKNKRLAGILGGLGVNY